MMRLAAKRPTLSCSWPVSTTPLRCLTRAMTCDECLFRATCSLEPWNRYSATGGNSRVLLACRPWPCDSGPMDTVSAYRPGEQRPGSPSRSHSRRQWPPASTPVPTQSACWYSPIHSALHQLECCLLLEVASAAGTPFPSLVGCFLGLRSQLVTDLFLMMLFKMPERLVSRSLETSMFAPL